MNEPHRGYIELPSLYKFDYNTDLHLSYVRECATFLFHVKHMLNVHSFCPAVLCVSFGSSNCCWTLDSLLPDAYPPYFQQHTQFGWQDCLAQRRTHRREVYLGKARGLGMGPCKKRRRSPARELFCQASDDRREGQVPEYFFTTLAHIQSTRLTGTPTFIIRSSENGQRGSTAIPSTKWCSSNQYPMR
jgi:hypothetical protein